AQAASATPAVQDQTRVATSAHPAAAPAAVHLTVQRTAAPAPLPKVTVKSGDSLSAIGARTSRTWPQLAGYNHIPNPDLIYPGQVLTIPPATYVPTGVRTSTPAVTTSSSTTTGSSTSGASTTHQTRTYSSSSSTATSSASSASGIWGCIAA